MANLRQIIALLSILFSFAVHGSVCTGVKPADNLIEMPTVAGEAIYQLLNPLKDQAAPNAVITEIQAFWLTHQQFVNETTTAPVSVETKPFPFTLGYCAPNPDDATKALTQYFTPANDFKKLATAETIVIRFVPNEVGPVTRYLRLKWKSTIGSTTTDKKETYTVLGTGGVPDYASDSRYKLWAYTGYTFLRSQEDFQDGFAELTVRAENRWLDARIALKQHNPAAYAEAVRTGTRCDLLKSDHAAEAKCPGARFSIVRIYGDMGLTGTTVVATGAGTTAQIGGVSQAFAGNIGLGIGKTRLVAFLKPTDTNAFSMLGVVRLGMITIPGEKDTNGNPIVGKESRSAFNSSVNLRIENEPGFHEDGTKAGNFEGAYIEIGFGESEQFARKKYPRLRFDGLVPINGNSDLFRFAGRLQIDAPRPFAKKKSDSPDNLANEIRISVLFNMDLLALGKRMSGIK